MYYYIMQQDNSSKEIPVIKDWYGKIDTLQMNPGGYQNLPDVSAFFADFAPNCHFKEIISVPFLLFPKEAGHIIKIFEPWLRYKDIVLISKTRKFNHKYIFPMLSKVDCIDDTTQFNLDKSVILKGVIKKNKIPDKSLFLLDKVNARTVVIREDLLECLLQEGYFGIKLQQLEVV